MLIGHQVQTVFELNWSNLTNGDILQQADSEIDLLITTDKCLRFQQNLDKFENAILVLPPTSWPLIRGLRDIVVEAVNSIEPGEYRKIT